MDSLFSIPAKYSDCHIHSCHSYDSNLSCEKILSVTKKKKIKLIGITDHDTIKGGVETKRLANDSEVEVIIGAEIETNAGEIIGFNLEEEIQSRDLIEVIKEIKDQGGLVVIPHPARWNKKKLPFEKIKDYIDGIEVFNGRNLTNISNIKAKYVASKWDFKTITGSDAHFSFEIGNNRVQVINWRGLLGFVLTACYKTFKFIIGK